MPSTLSLLDPRFSASSASADGYRLELDYAEPCNGANVCMAAQFTAQRGTTRPYGTLVALAGHIHGAFAPIQCGAACSPAAIQWRSGGVLYTITATLGIEVRRGVRAGQVRAAFAAAADQAITAGPR